MLVTKRVGRSKAHEVMPLMSAEDTGPLPVALVLDQDLEYRVVWNAQARCWLVMVRA
jgi:hypothetical protein